MKLKGKCEEEFNRWYTKSSYCEDYYITFVPDQCMLDEYKCIAFSEFPDSMKWGVFQDYFDELETKHEFNYLPIVTRGIDMFFITRRGVMERFDSRPEARTAAIEKAVELRNEQLNNNQ